MKGFDILKIKSAVKQHNKFDLSRTHLTTANFGQIIPLFCEETIPGDKFNVSGEYFSRLAPLVKPTYGKFSFKTVSAFVPYHQIAYDADAWFSGKTTWEGVTPIQRCIPLSELASFVNTYCADSVNTDDYDYCILTSAGVLRKFKFHETGRFYVKVLNSLGYALPQNVDGRSGSPYMSGYKDFKLSAYPLLAFFKLYNDYMSQSQRFNTSRLSAFLNNVKYNKTTSGYDSTTGFITNGGINLMFSELFLNYENDYFTSAWQKPNNPINLSQNFSAGNVPGSSYGDNEFVVGGVDDTYLRHPTEAGAGTYRYFDLGQRALDFLKSFDDWVRRNNYSGSRSVQQLYSRFGIKTDDFRSHYAQVITTDTMPVQVGDVMSTADTNVGVLGEYAGKGIMSGAKGFSVDVSDYGMIFVLGYFTVVPMNAYGFDRRVLRNNPFDYYNPEFDGIGADAIPYMEVYEDCTQDPTNDPTIGTNVFGFTERYNAYRYGRDVITGDFRNYKQNFMNCWHSGRMLGDMRVEGEMIAQSNSFNTLDPNHSEYNRIFTVTDDDVDHFYLTCRFKVDAIRPMLNLNSVVRLGEGDTLVPRNGNTIS